MPKVHITLVGGQTYPEYLGILDSKPDYVVFIHSVDTYDEAMRLSKEISCAFQFVQLDPVDIRDVYKRVEQLSNTFNEDNDIVVDVTSGTKIWSIACFKYFSIKPNVKLIYVDQNNKIYDLLTGNNHTPLLPLKTDLALRLNGNEPNSYSDLSSYTEEDANAINTIKRLRKTNHKDFTEFTVNRKEPSAMNEGDLSIAETGSMLSWNRKQGWIKVLIKNKRGEEASALLDSLHAFNLFFHTGWFEFEVALMLSKWKYTKSIWVNVIFPYTNSNPKNEVDIIVNTGDKLLFVECKTQINDITDIDKFRTAVKNYGGMGCKALFVTEARMKKEASEKCQDSGIISFSLSDCGNLLSQDKALYMLLDQELFGINKK